MGLVEDPEMPAPFPWRDWAAPLVGIVLSALAKLFPPAAAHVMFWAGIALSLATSLVKALPWLATRREQGLRVAVCGAMSLLTLAAMVWSVIGMPVPKRTIRLTIAGTTPHQTGTPVVLDLPGDAKKPLPVVKVDEPTGTAGETVDARIAPPDPGPTIEAVIPPKPEAVSEAAPASDPPLAQPPSPPQNIRLVAPESGNSAPPAPVRLRFVQP